MLISIKPIILSLLLTAAFQQLPYTSMYTPSNNSYLSSASTNPSSVNVPSAATAAPSATPTSSSPSSASPVGGLAVQPVASSPTNLSSSSQTDLISPNQYTFTNLLKNDALTTNPTASPNLNTGYYNYNTATTAFTATSQLGGGCNGQNKISYVAFKQYSTQFYLTPNLYFLTLLQNNSPNQQQLFTAIQNVDCTWSFKTSDGMYVSLNTAFSYLTLSTTLSVG
jgi:hypothetical protein